MSSITFQMDSTLFLRHAVALRTHIVPAAAAKAKEWLDGVMANAKDGVNDWYTAGGNANPPGPNPGELADSGYVDEPKITGVSVMIEAGFGREGPASEYALYVHEGHHLIAWGRDTGTDLPAAKYWEGPLMEAWSTFEEDTGMEIGVAVTQSWDNV